MKGGINLKVSWLMSGLTLKFLFLMLMLFSNISVKFLFELKIWNQFNLFILVDKTSLFFCFFLFMMVSAVMSFSSFYMKTDHKSSYFISVLFMFIMSMVFLIFFPDLFFVLLGWDGLGITSFLLIIYYSSKNSWSCGFKTFLINRLGDGLLMMAVVVLMSNSGYFISSLKYVMKGMCSMVLFLGLCTKSAQFPFSSWLPAAMAAPTPVSALVHSSTLVTAGMYLILRKISWLGKEFKMSLFMMGSWTLILASFSALVEKDVKKMIAFSTLSQLGLMCLIISMGLIKVGFFHLLTHACFKALLFILAGVLLFKLNHDQDIRQLGGKWYISSMMKISMVVVKFSLCGLFFLSGFYSKDKLIEYLFPKSCWLIKLWVVLISVMTVLYSFRLISGLSCGSKGSGVKINSTFFSLKSMVYLFSLSVVSGKLLNSSLSDLSFISSVNKSVLIMLMGIFMTMVLTSAGTGWMSSSKFMNKMFNVPFMDSKILVKSFSMMGWKLEQLIKWFKNSNMMKSTGVLIESNMVSQMKLFSLFSKFLFSYWWVIMVMSLFIMTM